MDPAGLGQCSKLLVAAAFFISGATPTLAFWGPDKATEQTTQICDRSFAPKNADMPYVSSSRERTLNKACQWGASYAHDTIYDPYKNSNSTSTDFPLGLPDVHDFRNAYLKGLKNCELGYDDKSGLQERMACMDGYDYFAGNLALQSEDYGLAGGAKPDRAFGHEYFQRHTYLNVYQDIADDQTWASVLMDRVFSPERYPGYRRDQLFSPDVPASQKDNVARFAGGGSSGSTVQSNNNSSLFWYLYWKHYATCYTCGGYSSSASYRRDDVGRAGGMVGDGSPPAAFGPRAPAREYAPGSPWSQASRASAPSSGAVRGGLGAYGGYGHVGDGAHSSIPSAKSITSTSGSATGSMGNSVSVSRGASPSAGSYGSYGGAARGSMGSMSAGGGGGGGHASSGGGGGHGGSSGG